MLHSVVDIVTAFGALGGWGAVFLSWRNASKLNTMHVEMNGNLKALLEKTGAAARAEGFEAGRNEMRP